MATTTSQETAKVVRQGEYIDLGGLWVRFDCIGTVKQIDGADGAPYCQVVLTLPGYKTLGVGCAASDLIDAVTRARQHAEVVIGLHRAKGMRA